MSLTKKSDLLKHTHHLLTVANGVNTSGTTYLKTAPTFLETRLHKVAKDVVSGHLPLPKAHRTPTKVDGIIRFAEAPATIVERVRQVKKK